MRTRWWTAARLTARDAAASLLLRPGHTLGMVSGILLGITSVTGAVVIADTQQAQVDLRFDLQRSDVVAIQADQPVPAGFSGAQLAWAARLQPVSAVGEFSKWSDDEPVGRSAGDARLAAPVLVADPGGLAATETVVTSGADADLLGIDSPLRIAWIGDVLARRLGVGPADGGAGTDAQIVLDGIPFSVAGIVSNEGGFDYVSSSVVLSRPTVLHSLGGSGINVRVMARVRPGSAGAVARSLVVALDPAHDLALTDVTPPDGEILLGNVGSDLRRVGAALGIFMGLVGMVAVANTLSLSVHQRRRELGLRSAMGWSRRRIGLLVLTESAIAGLIAGLLGSAVGLASAAAWCRLHDWTMVLPPSLPLLVVAAGVIASVLGALLPTYRAATTSPLDALRS